MKNLLKIKFKPAIYVTDTAEVKKIICEEYGVQEFQIHFKEHNPTVSSFNEDSYWYDCMYLVELHNKLGGWFGTVAAINFNPNEN